MAHTQLRDRFLLQPDSKQLMRRLKEQEAGHQQQYTQLYQELLERERKVFNHRKKVFCASLLASAFYFINNNSSVHGKYLAAQSLLLHEIRGDLAKVRPYTYPTHFYADAGNKSYNV